MIEIDRSKRHREIHRASARGNKKDNDYLKALSRSRSHFNTAFRRLFTPQQKPPAGGMCSSSKGLAGDPGVCKLPILFPSDLSLQSASRSQALSRRFSVMFVAPLRPK
jgi:hypothetical protein